MSFNGQLLATGGVAQCLTDSVQVFGADGTYSSNIAVYQFNGDATDTTGNYSANTQGSPSYVTGKFGQAASLSNSDTDYFTTSISPTILGNSFALSAWVYFTQNSGGSDYYSIAGAYWNGSSGNQSWIFYVNNGTLSFFSNLSSGSITVTGGTVPLNQWNFVAFSVDDKNEISLYLNGVQTTSAVSLSLLSNSINLTLGNLGTYNASRTMYGLLDQVRVFDRALTVSEMDVLYNETDSTTSNTNLLNDGAGVALYTLDYDGSDAGGLYNGTPTNVDFGVGGQILYGARFNGSSSSIQINTFSGFTNYNFTLSIWINSTDTQGYITSFRDPIYISFILGGYSGGTNGMGIYDGTNQYFINNTAMQGINDGNWHHIVMTHDGTNLKGYIDKLLIATVSTGTTTQSSGGTNHNRIGMRGDGNSSSFDYNGLVDQLRLFSKALDQTEVDTLYAEIACNYTCTTDTVNYPDTTNLAYYKLDNSSDDETGVYDGASTDVLYTFGRFGQAAVFNGSSSKIVLPSIDWTTITISFWINARSDSEGGNRNNVASDGTINRNCIFINKDYIGDGRVPLNSISYFDNSYANSVSATWEDDTWIHIAVTLSGQDMAIYKNGILADSATISGRPTGNKTYNWGKNGTSFFTGNLDQIRLFASVLSADKITELYNEKPCADTSNFKATLYDGNSNSAGQYVSNVGFQPDLTWIKYTNANIRHLITDSITGPSVYEGAGITTHSNELFVSNTYGEFTSFDANGFIVRFWSGSQYFNTSGYDYVAWNWKGGGAAVLNQNGGTNSQVSANTAAGFSIVNWSGDNSTTTIGHGLNSPPEVVIRKNLGTSNWAFDTTAIDGSFDYLFLNTTAQKADHTSLSAPTSTVFSTSGTAFNSSSMIAYCWHSVAGYSKIGSYPGNGTTSNPVSDPSFEPSFVMIKRTDSTSNWRIFDNARGTNVELYANSSSQDVSATGYINFNPNGFEITTTGAWLNAIGGTYLYMAFK